MDKQRIKNKIKLAISILLITLVLLELVLRLFPVEDPYEANKKIEKKRSYILSEYEPHMSFKFSSNEGLPFVDRNINFSTNNYGFRGHELLLPKPEKAYRVFLVGGSTTECLYIDDSKSNNALMEQYLKPINGEVFNAGKSGDFSADHVAMISNRILHLEPDLIVLFCGINDLWKVKYDYSHRPVNQVQTPRRLEYYKLFLSDFQIYRRIYNVFKKHSPETILMESDYKSKVKWLSKMSYGNELPDFNTQAYEKNLRSIIGMCKVNNIQLLLVSQAVTWDSSIDDFKDLNWLSFIGEDRFKEKDLKKQMNIYNDIMERIASETNTPFYDLSSDIPASKTYFYDDCHFNNKGTKYFSKHVADLIMKRLKL